MKQLEEYQPCGLNADWSCDAWFIYSATNKIPNEFGVGVYIIDLEDGNYGIAVRDLSDDNDNIEVPCQGPLDMCLSAIDELEQADWKNHDQLSKPASSVVSLL